MLEPPVTSLFPETPDSPSPVLFSLGARPWQDGNLHSLLPTSLIVTVFSLSLWGSLSCSSFWDPTQPHWGLPLLLGPSPHHQSLTLTSLTVLPRERLEFLVLGEKMVPRGRRDALDPLETLAPPGSWAKR